MLTEYTWAVAVGGIFCFLLGGGMGANDVANNFGTSVGSRSISLKRALFIAAVFELIGSIGFGATVTDSVRNGVYDLGKLEVHVAKNRSHEFLLIANLTVLFTVAIWLYCASSLKMSVSTTHSIIGAYMGCGLAISPRVVHWKYLLTILSSWVGAPLLAALVAASLFTALRAAVLRAEHPVRRANLLLPLLCVYVAFIISLFFVFSNPLVFASHTCVQKNSDGIIAATKPCYASHWVSAHLPAAWGIGLGAAAATSLILYVPIKFWTKRTITAEQEKKKAGLGRSWTLADLPRRTLSFAADGAFGTDSVAAGTSDAAGEGASATSPISLSTKRAHFASASEDELSPGGSTVSSHWVDGPDSTPSGSTPDGSTPGEVCQIPVRSASAVVLPVEEQSAEVLEEVEGACCGGRFPAPWNRDLHAEAAQEESRVGEIQALSEKFPWQAEAYFKALQTCSAALACLVHGSNDVGNAAAPFAAIYSIYREGAYLKSIPVPLWVLALGGCSISIGLMLLGYKVIRTVGIELLHMNAPKGFCVEMAVFTVIISASYLGLTISSTHIGIGAMIGVGLMDRHFDPFTLQDVTQTTCGLNLRAINWPLAGKLAVSWVGTLILCCTAGYILMTFAIRSPSINHT
ncbi:putative phosphate transporter [Gregarina niphandrodes]|uniref:Phosphate transporter n=1 Tax=Gregarina niphandrodes TaxID=110365 RepID=A0A023B153_GRENI|nr:putative phosphate transporter [Gregarina niphandrodes]EZG46756.1 putative phosphate transporter [Gregarina niphandrodes]|eukprot:XP_011132265.1 putative phosphate transporter [Gregarina niphandrodes]